MERIYGVKNGGDRRSESAMLNVKMQSDIREELLYRIADMGYLHRLKGVGKSKFEPNKRVWFFDPDPSIQRAVDAYIAERRAEVERENEAYEN